MAIITAGSVAPPPSGRPPDHNLVPRDVVALADELVAYHAAFAPLFHRSEQRHWALAYLQGQLLDLERKAIEPMALALKGGDVQAMQQFISKGAWDDDRILEQHQRLVAETLGDAETGVLILDGCDFSKQGTHSVGVARQWCGALGKVANCQASVVACYASTHGYRLYLGGSTPLPAQNLVHARVSRPLGTMRHSRRHPVPDAPGTGRGVGDDTARTAGLTVSLGDLR